MHGRSSFLSERTGERLESFEACSGTVFPSPETEERLGLEIGSVPLRRSEESHGGRIGKPPKSNQGGRHTSSTEQLHGASSGILRSKHVLKPFLVPLPAPSVNLERLPWPTPNCRDGSIWSLRRPFLPWVRCLPKDFRGRPMPLAPGRCRGSPRPANGDEDLWP